jgi:hypothetical protein
MPVEMAMIFLVLLFFTKGRNAVIVLATAITFDSKVTSSDFLSSSGLSSLFVMLVIMRGDAKRSRAHKNARSFNSWSEYRTALLIR